MFDEKWLTVIVSICGLNTLYNASLKDASKPIMSESIFSSEESFYRVGQNVTPKYSTHNFVKCMQIFNIRSLSHSPGNLQ